MLLNIKLNKKDNFVIYTTEDNKINVEVFLENENLWMNQEQISKLFEKAKSTINEHIKNIYEEGELKEEDTLRKFGNTEFERSDRIRIRTDPVVPRYYF